MLKSGEFALGVCVGLVAFIAFYLIYNAFKVDLDQKTLLDFIPSLLTLIVAITSLFLSFYALAEQRKMRQAGTDPVLVAFFDQREDAAELIIIRVANVGAGAALNVRVEIISNEVGFDDGIFDKKNLGSNPLRTIPQGDSVYFNFGRGFELLELPLPEPVTVNLTYESIEGEKSEKNFILDVRQMAQLPSHRKLAARQTISFEKMSKVLAGTSSKLDEILLEVTKMNSNIRQWQANRKRK